MFASISWLVVSNLGPSFGFGSGGDCGVWSPK